MSGGGGKGGSQTTKVEIPEFIERAGERNIDKAEEISRIGYVPYFGPDVAAMTPMEESAGQNVMKAAGAFGLADPFAGTARATPAGQGIAEHEYLMANPDVLQAVQSGAMPSARAHYEQFGQFEGRDSRGLGAQSAMAGMPQAQSFGGVSAYSSAPLYQQAIQNLQREAPGQFQALTAPFIDPFTGAQPVSPYGLGSEFAAQTAEAEAAYLARNPDVAQAVNEGIFKDATEHYQRYGQFEGRDPMGLGYRSQLDIMDKLPAGTAQLMERDNPQANTMGYTKRYDQLPPGTVVASADNRFDGPGYYQGRDGKFFFADNSETYRRGLNYEETSGVA